MSWVAVNKPTGNAYINVNASGKEQYDQGSIAYDDVNTYYDGVNMNQYTKVAKPTTNAWVKVNKPT